MQTILCKITPKSFCVSIKIILIIFALSGCSLTTFKMYSGTELPKSQIALLLVSNPIGVSYIDEQWFGARFVRQFMVELLPGSHEITVHFNITVDDYSNKSSQNFSSKRPIVLNFEAKAGHTYSLYSKTDIGFMAQRGKWWNAWIEDVTKQWPCETLGSHWSHCRGIKVSSQ